MKTPLLITLALAGFLAGCTTVDGSFDPVATQIAAHDGHYKAALAAEVAVAVGSLKGPDAKTVHDGLDKGLLIILTADAFINPTPPDLADAAKKDADETVKADAILKAVE